MTRMISQWANFVRIQVDALSISMAVIIIEFVRPNLTIYFVLTRQSSIMSVDACMCHASYGNRTRIIVISCRYSNH
jgi:hypothetical protein